MYLHLLNKKLNTTLQKLKKYHETKVFPTCFLYHLTDFFDNQPSSIWPVSDVTFVDVSEKIWICVFNSKETNIFFDYLQSLKLKLK